jgi:hypothetical protein
MGHLAERYPASWPNHGLLAESARDLVGRVTMV